MENKTCSKPPARFGLARQMNQTIIPSISIEHHPAVQGTHLLDTYPNNQKCQYLSGTKSHIPSGLVCIHFIYTLAPITPAARRGKSENIYMNIWEFERDQWFVNVNGLNFSPRMQQSSFETRVLFDKLNLE